MNSYSSSIEVPANGTSMLLQSKDTFQSAEIFNLLQ